METPSAGQCLGCCLEGGSADEGEDEGKFAWAVAINSKMRRFAATPALALLPPHSLTFPFFKSSAVVLMEAENNGVW